MTPKRIQRSRAKGANQPPNTKYCGRPGFWGNPFYVSKNIERGKWDVMYDGSPVSVYWPTKLEAQQAAVNLFRQWFDPRIAEIGTDLHKFRDLYSWDGFTRAILLTTNAGLKSYDHLSCWCGLSDPCHVDVIIERLTAAK